MWQFELEWPQNLVCLDAWSQVGRNVWERLVGMAFGEKVCHWGQAWRFKKPTPVSVRTLSHACESRCKLSAMLQHHPCLPTAMLPSMMLMDSYTMKLEAPDKLFL